MDTTHMEQVYSPPDISGATNQGTNGVTNQDQNKMPYIDLLPAYTDANNKAIENGSVPSYLEPLIRNYFSSLAPQ